MFINKTTSESGDDVRDWINLDKARRERTTLLLQAENGKRVLITSQFPYPFELVQDRPVRDMAVIAPIGALPDVVGRPGVLTELAIPPAIGVPNQVGSAITYEWKDVKTGTVHSTSVPSFMVYSHPDMDGEKLYLVRIVDNAGHTTDWEALWLLSRPLGYMSVIDIDHDMPLEIIRNSSGVLVIDATYNTSLANDVPHVKIISSKGITFNSTDNLPLGGNILFNTPNYLGQGYIKFYIEHHSGYRSEEQEIRFTVKKNAPPVLSGLVHTLPYDADLGSVINFQWWGLVDPDGDALTMEITQMWGATVARTTGIGIGEPNSIVPDDPTSGTIAIKFHFTDGFSNTNFIEHVININDYPPVVDDVTYLLDGEDGFTKTVDSCRTYQCVIDGATDPNNLDIGIQLWGPDEIDFSKVEVAQGEQFSVTVGCATDTTKGSWFMAQFVNGVSDKTVYMPLRTDPIHGYALITNPTIMVKPPGVTEVVIKARGGKGVNTTVVGEGLNMVWAGAPAGSEIFPELDDRLVSQLPADIYDFIVNPAPGTLVSITW